MKLIPYVTFGGNAQDALAHYADVFQVTPEAVVRFSDMPDQDWVNDNNKDRLAHGRINVGGAQLMLSDTGGAEPFQGHLGHSINIELNDLEEAKRVFSALAEDGAVVMPFAKTFWAEGFGTCRDRFGVSWMVNYVSAD